MNVVDSSGWIEYFTAGPRAEVFAPVIEKVEALVVPTLSILEVFRRILQLRGEPEALAALVAMEQGKVVPLSAELATRAAKLGLEHKLPMADSVMLATARHFQATLWTQDSDFAGIEGVRYITSRA